MGPFPYRDGLLSDPHPRLLAALGRRYAVERELGRGGMGTVYLATDLKHGRQVAIKVLPPELAAALGSERFLREIRVAARLSHPHILPLHDSGQVAGTLYYVMPHVEGESLRTRLARTERLPTDQAAEIARQVADALAYAHAAGIIHRDIKPENILLAGDHALLADFGVAKVRAGDGESGRATTLRTDTGVPVGTPAYASPEQAAGRRDLDGRSDIYSLGCVLYEMLVGAPTASSLLENRFAAPLPSVRTLRPDVPQWVDDVLRRALAPESRDRFQNSAHFRDALARRAGVGSLPGPKPAATPIAAGRRLLWMAGGAAALAAIGAALAFLPRAAVAFDSKRIVVAGFENRTGDSAFAPVSEIAADYIARGLASTGLMHEVYDARATAREAGEPVPAGAAGGLRLAKRVGAGTVLSGSYYLDADSLHFEAQLLDGQTGQLIAPLQPSIGLAREKTEVVEQLRQRVMAGLAAVLGSEFDTWQAASLPPTYEAYQEMLAGQQSGDMFEFGEAAEHYARAAALDTTFTGAQTSRAVMLWLAGNCDAVDSIARRLRPKRHLLPAADLGQLDFATATCTDDADGALRAIRKALGSAPRSRYFGILGSVVALEHLRPKESLEILRRVDVEKLGFANDDLYNDWLGMTYHMLGDYQRELAVSGNPAALAGLGRVAEAEQAAIRALPAQHTGDDPWPAPMASECVALELQAHGHPEAAQRIRERIIAWYGKSIDAATRHDFPCMQSRFSVFYYAGRWDEARAGYEHMLARDSTSLKAHAALGALAVRRGDKAEADRMESWLAAQKGPNADYARARMAALRGDRQRTVDLIREAFEERLGGRMFLHLDPDFESVRDFPAYRELVQPKL